ncbi:hypothetical protein FRC01_012434 [Tulasnella sp. 417]|nr:hypothetical protein FRC01_012434 [Tulasnella sp. 417]
MDDFSWGNTRLVVGEGANKKVIMDDDEKFDESMIPLKKFSEYEAEAWETGSLHSGAHTYDATHKTRSRRPSRSGNASPVSFHPASQSGDFYRDTNALGKSGGASPRAGSVRGDQAQSTISQFGMGPPQLGPVGTMGPMGMNPFGTMHQMGSMGFLPYMGGSHAGSDYGGMLQPQMTGMTGMGPMGPMGAGSMYGGGMAVPRNSVMTNLNMFGGPGSVAGGPAPSVAGMGGMARPLSTFSVDPFGGTGPSPNDNPSDEELLAVLRHYLSTQDLMTVTKKTARAAVEAKFPRADLSGRKDFLNKSIDDILSSS